MYLYEIIFASIDGGDSLMTNLITVLTTASRTNVGKVFKGPDLKQGPFAVGKEFYVSKEPVSDLKSLSALLQRLEDDPTHTIIRGSLVDGQNSPVPRNNGIPSQQPLANGA